MHHTSNKDRLPPDSLAWWSSLGLQCDPGKGGILKACVLAAFGVRTFLLSCQPAPGKKNKTKQNFRAKNLLHCFTFLDLSFLEHRLFLAPAQCPHSSPVCCPRFKEVEHCRQRLKGNLESEACWTSDLLLSRDFILQHRRFPGQHQHVALFCLPF